MRPINRNRIRGLTLIEMMIALTISSIVVAAFASLLLSSRDTQGVRIHISSLSETARFFTEFFASDVRMAGRSSDSCPLSHPGLAWNDDTQVLSINFCEYGAASPTSLSYQFDPSTETVRYSNKQGITKPLLDGVVMNGIWFGKMTPAGRLRYVNADSSDFESIRSVRINFTFILVNSRNKHLSTRESVSPVFEFTVAIRNNLYASMPTGSTP